MFVGPLAALVVAAVLRNDASPTPAPSPTPTTPTRAPILAGITLGEDAKGVLRRFGLVPQHSSFDTAIVLNDRIVHIRIFPAHYGDVLIGISFFEKIQNVMVFGTSDPRGHCADPFGVRLGDAPQRLVELRGNPDGYGANGDVRYGPKDGIHWFYSVSEDKISIIGVSDGS
jgi:hypothetical protein